MTQRALLPPRIDAPAVTYRDLTTVCHMPLCTNHTINLFNSGIITQTEDDTHADRCAVCNVKTAQHGHCITQQLRSHCVQ